MMSEAPADITGTPDQQKRAAALAAVDLIEDGMRVGLGTGSTAAHFVAALGERVARGLAVSCAATSAATEALAAEHGLTVRPLEDLAPLDLTVDGADELDGDLRLIKGGGGALLREKIVAAASLRMVVIADASKLVDTLGGFPLPVEVVPFGAPVTAHHIGHALKALGFADHALARRENGAGTPVITDSGNWIFDAHLARIEDPAAVAATLAMIPGVVDHGLFLTLARTALLGTGPAPDTVRRIDRPAG